MGRAPCCDKASVKKGPWSPEEDATLKAYIEENGTGGNWIALPHKIGLKRCGKSCRLRWLNYLRPNIKHGGFSEEEDNIISSLYISIGSRWSIIAAQLPGRTDNDIKNYWNTRLKKKLLGRRKETKNRGLSPSTEEQSRTGNDVNNEAADSSQARLSTSALERLQLHMQLGGLNSLSFFHNPAMWPYKLIHPDHLADGVVQGQHDAAISADSAAQRAHPFGRPTNKMSSQEPAFASNSEISGCIGGNKILGELNGSSCMNGLPTSLSSPAAFNTEQSNASFNPSAAYDQADFSDLFCGKNGGFEGEGLSPAPPLNDLVCFDELVGTNEGTVWWTGSCFEEQKSCSSWGSASAAQPPTMMFQPQDYALGYDC